MIQTATGRLGKRRERFKKKKKKGLCPNSAGRWAGLPALTFFSTEFFFQKSQIELAEASESRWQESLDVRGSQFKTLGSRPLDVGLHYFLVTVIPVCSPSRLAAPLCVCVCVRLNPTLADWHANDSENLFSFFFRFGFYEI